MLHAKDLGVFNCRLFVAISGAGSPLLPFRHTNVCRLIFAICFCWARSPLSARAPGADTVEETSRQPMGINEQLITIIKWYSTPGRQHTYIYQLLISSSCPADSCLSARRKAAVCGCSRASFLVVISGAPGWLWVLFCHEILS